VCDQGVVLRSGEVAFIGSAADATKVHREILEGKRKANVAAEPGEPRALSRIVAVRVLDSMRNAVSELVPGEDLVVEISVDHLEAQKEWFTTFSIDTPAGQQVFGTGARRLGTSHGRVEAGRVTVEYLIPGIAFGGGQYFVNADVADGQHQRMDVLWQGANFFVPMNDRSTGTVHAEASLLRVG